MALMVSSSSSIAAVLCGRRYWTYGSKTMWLAVNVSGKVLRTARLEGERGKSECRKGGIDSFLSDLYDT